MYYIIHFQIIGSLPFSIRVPQPGIIFVKRRQFVLGHQMHGVYRPTEKKQKQGKKSRKTMSLEHYLKKKRRGVEKAAWARSKPSGRFSQRLGEVIRVSGAV
jgi:hypothetical protein